MDLNDSKPDASTTKSEDAKLDDMNGNPLQMIQTLLASVQEKFQVMSEEITSRMEIMTNRITEIEQGVADLTQQLEQQTADVKVDNNPESIEAPTSTS